jgi:hypothetical protein
MPEMLMRTIIAATAALLLIATALAGAEAAGAGR